MSAAPDQLVYFISGMWCTSCAKGVREAVAGIDGVKAAEVNYASKLLLVEAKADAVTCELNDLIQTKVDRIGFGIKKQSEGWILGFRDELMHELDGRLSWTFISLIWFLAMWSSMFAFARYAGGGLLPTESFYLALASSACGLPAIMLGIQPYARSGLRSLFFGRRLSLDLFVACGGCAAILVTLVSISSTSPITYADSGSMIVAILLLTKKMENVIVKKVTSSILFQLNPGKSSLSVLRNGSWREAEAAQIRKGDQIRIAAQATIPLDGTLIYAAKVNSYLLNGENQAISLLAGDAVFAGSVALSQLELSVTQPQGQRRIDGWAETAMAGKTRSASYSKFFTKLESGATGMAFSGALALGAWSFLHGHRTGAAMEAFFIGILIFCPCLFASILPLTKQLAHLALIKRGVFMSRTEALLDLTRVRRFFFDKTGTLEAVETVFIPFAGNERVTAYVEELGAKSRHPILRGLAGAKDHNALRALVEIPGKGVTAVTEAGDRLLVGRLSYLLQQEVTETPAVDPDFPAVALNGKIVGQILVTYLYNQKAKKFLRKLLRISPEIEIAILSGDPALQAGARLLGVDRRISYSGNLSPEDKASAVGPGSAYVGDGLNDTLALAAADVSFRVGHRVQGFAPVDFQLTGQNLDPILSITAYARKYRLVLWQTAIAALLYNFAAFSLAALGEFSPLGAVLAMLGSFSLLLLSALRLLKVPEVT